MSILTQLPIVAATVAAATVRTLLVGLPIILAVVLLLLGLVIYIGLWVAPMRTPRILASIILHTFYRVRIVGAENLPRQGPALLVGNHLSYLDGIFMLYVSPRPVRMIVWEGNFRRPVLRHLTNKWRAILVSAGPKSIVRALREANEGLKNGDLVGMFPEGSISRTGLLQRFRPGMLRVLEGTDAPVIPFYFDGVWGSIFSHSGGKFLWKWPKRIPYPITIYIGKPIRQVKSTYQVRLAVQEIEAEAARRRIAARPIPVRKVLRSCKRRRFSLKVADTTQVELTGASLLMRALILRRLLRRSVLERQDRHVGVLLPPSSGAVTTNLSLSLDRRVAINLNYTVTSDVLNDCLTRGEIRHVLTSRKVMEKLQLTLDANVVYLEDLREELRTSDKLVAALAAYLAPAWLLERWLQLTGIASDELMTIVFTSGSTGVPKGVMLTHANINSNIEAIDQVIALKRSDTIVGILPFFHSFGYTVTLWSVLALDIRGVYHFTPLDARQIGKLTRRYQATVLLSTPTFLRTFVRRCPAEDFQSLDTVVAGAEKLPTDLADAFEAKFQVRPVEGYGTTELSPLVSVNIPPSRSLVDWQVDRKEGSVGHSVPGVAVRTADLDTGEVLEADESGMLHVTGPNVMKGYLKMPDKTAEVMVDGWYVTGDVAKIDQDGFIWITGRQSRFSKIGGEMVPHVLIEEKLQAALRELEQTADQQDGEDGGPQVAVTAVADPKKGERLVVLHTPMKTAPETLRAKLQEQGLPNIFIPSPDSFYEVPEIPMLGSGKLDLRRLKQLALQRTGQPTTE